MPTRYKRIHFFSGPATSLNDKLLTQNIPSELTMRQLLDSSAFISEPQDGTSPTQQGLIKYYFNNDAIDNRDNPNLQRGNIHALLPNQAPGVGVENKGYKEGNPTTTSDNQVSGQGIKVTGLLNTNPTGINRIGYQIEFDPDNLSEYQPADTSIVIGFVVNDNNGRPRIYKASPSQLLDNHFAYEHKSEKTVWNITHKLNKFPSVTITDDTKTIIQASVQYTDENTVVITHTRPQKGWAFFN
jgi:hypothetical protein